MGEFINFLLHRELKCDLALNWQNFSVQVRKQAKQLIPSNQLHHIPLKQHHRHLISRSRTPLQRHQMRLLRMRHQEPTLHLSSSTHLLVHIHLRSNNTILNIKWVLQVRFNCSQTKFIAIFLVVLVF